jgi:hypothetical protein
VIRYRLIDEDGLDLGPFVSMRIDWDTGDTLARRPDERFTVVNVVVANEHESFYAYLIVQRG